MQGTDDVSGCASTLSNSPGLICCLPSSIARCLNCVLLWCSTHQADHGLDTAAGGGFAGRPEGAGHCPAEPSGEQPPCSCHVAQLLRSGCAGLTLLPYLCREQTQACWRDEKHHSVWRILFALFLLQPSW